MEICTCIGFVFFSPPRFSNQLKVQECYSRDFIPQTLPRKSFCGIFRQQMPGSDAWKSWRKIEFFRKCPWVFQILEVFWRVFFDMSKKLLLEQFWNDWNETILVKNEMSFQMDNFRFPLQHLPSELIENWTYCRTADCLSGSWMRSFWKAGLNQFPSGSCKECL